MNDHDDIEGFEEDFAAFGQVEFDEADEDDGGFEMRELAVRVQAARFCA